MHRLQAATPYTYFTTGQSWWIWSAEGTHKLRAGDTYDPYGVRRFRRSFQVQDPQAVRLHVAVSADSRYIFFCNGQRVGRGPAKGDVFHQFYETYDLTPLLVPGENVLAALVLDFSRIDTYPAQLGAPTSVMTNAGAFIMEGVLEALDGTPLVQLSTQGESQWKVMVDTSYRFHSDQNVFGGFVGYFEHFHSARAPRGWNVAGFDDSAWEAPVVIDPGDLAGTRRDSSSPYGLLARVIPQLEEDKQRGFVDVFHPGGAPAAANVSAWLKGNGTLNVAAGQELRLVLDAGELTTGYPVLKVAGGAGAQLRMTYAEAFRLPVDTTDARLLSGTGDQACISSGYLNKAEAWTYDRRGTVIGWCDIFEPAGGEETYEPFHWRTFHFIELVVTAGAQPLTLHSVNYRFTSYPLEIQSNFHSSQPKHERYWDVSLRTLRLCTHETFEDCPYYEQMQYCGDSEVTSLLAMLVSADARLTQQALFHFDWSRMPDGITQSRYPSRLNQIIPSFSLHWISMVRDYYRYTGDRDTLRVLLPGMNGVLQWMRRYSDENGLPARLPYWNCTDWCTEWDRGVPPGWDSGPTCIISSQYLYALKQVQWMEEQAGDLEQAARMTAEIQAVQLAIHEQFWSETEGLYYDRPGGPQMSQLGNAWAVLCGAAGPEQQRRMLRRFPGDPALSRAAFFGIYFIIRALREMDRGDLIPGMLSQWDEMLDYGLTTWAEETTYWRSLCHAWSAHPVIDFLTEILGVQPLQAGYHEIRVAPKPTGLTWARGTVATPRGPVRVAWEIVAGEFHLQVSAPPNTPVRIDLPDGQEMQYDGGEIDERCAMPEAAGASLLETSPH